MEPLSKQLNIRRYGMVIWCVFAIAVFFRIFTAWMLDGSTSADYGIPCLMAKHMAEGTAFPAFYYGQPYMGSLEPFVSSLFVRFMGMSGFACNLGTAVFGILFLVALWLWTGRAGGRTAATAALLFVTIGPPHYFQFSSWCYGGYGAILFLSPAMLLVADIIIEREKTRTAGRLDYLLLGLLAGIAWWTSPLMLAIFLTVAVLFLIAVNLGLFNRRIWTFMPGFFIGSLPFWIWNAQNNWETFRHFLSKVGLISFGAGLHRYINELLVRYIAIQGQEWLLPVYLIILIAFIWDTVLSFRHDRNKAAFRIRMAAVLAQVFLPLLFCTSPYSADRYLTVVMCSFALIVGIGTARLVMWLPFKLGWLPVCILMINQATFLPMYWGWHKGNEEHGAKIQALAQTLRTNGISAVYCAYGDRGFGHGLNAYLNEEFAFCDPKAERVQKYAEQAESASMIGVLNYHGNIDRLTDGSGGTSETDYLNGIKLTYGFKPPALDFKPLNPSEIIHPETGTDRQILNIISDLDAQTAWSEILEPGASKSITMAFKETYNVNGIRLFSLNNVYPTTLSLWYKENVSDDWQPVFSSRVASHYIWSGPRPFFRQNSEPWTLRFETIKAGHLQIEVTGWSEHVPVEITELSILEASDPLPDEEDYLPEMLEFLTKRGINRLYAGRWLSNKAALSMPELMSSQVPGLFGEKPVLPSSITWTPETAMAVLACEAPACRAVLSERHLQWQEHTAGPWIVFSIPDEMWKDEYTLDHGLYWTGDRCLKGNWAQTAIELSIRAEAEGRLDEAMALAEEAHQSAPGYYKTYDRLGFLYKTLGREAESKAAMAAARDLKGPENPTMVQFGKDLSLMGIDHVYDRLPDGQVRVDTQYYWKCPTNFTPENYAVFVHVKDTSGNIVVQDDHILLEGNDLSNRLLNEPLIANRSFTVPAGSDDTLEFWLGVYSRIPPGHRLPVKSDLETHRRAVKYFTIPR